MAYRLNVPDFAFGMNYPKIELEPRPFSGRFFELFDGPGLIIRVNSLKELFE
jgi:hypothetical protein